MRTRSEQSNDLYASQSWAHQSIQALLAQPSAPIDAAVQSICARQWCQAVVPGSARCLQQRQATTLSTESIMCSDTLVLAL